MTTQGDSGSLPEEAKHYLVNITSRDSLPLDTNPVRFSSAQDHSNVSFFALLTFATVQNGEPFVDPLIFTFVEGRRSVWGVTIASNIATETIWWIDRNINLRFTCGDDPLGAYRLVHLYYGSRIARAAGLNVFYLDREAFHVRQLNIGTWEELKRRIAGITLSLPITATSVFELATLYDALISDSDQEDDARSVQSDTTGESSIWLPGYPRDRQGHRRSKSLPQGLTRRA